MKELEENLYSQIFHQNPNLENPLEQNFNESLMPSTSSNSRYWQNAKSNEKNFANKVM